MNEIQCHSQAKVLALQTAIARDLPPVELEYDHLFASGSYARVMKAPAGTAIVGKAHRDDHICILVKGSLLVTMDDGTVNKITAPAYWVAKGGQKKAGLVIEDIEFINIHAVDTTDLDEIESKVIIPEAEYALQIKETTNMNKKLTSSGVQ